jgi:NADPH-dependent ferric siderophore reductase
MTIEHHEEAVQTRPNERWSFPLPPRMLSIPGVQPLELEVVETTELGPNMRRIRLTGPGLEGFTYEPGQDIMFVLSSGERPLSRRYTIRAYDPAQRTVELNIVTHGVHGPGAHWAAGTQVGDRINGVGPRGKIFIDRQADWHLFLGDESAAPGSLHMLESLPSPGSGRAYLEVSGAEDELPTTAASVTWLHRGELRAIDSNGLAEAMAAADLPAGRGHVYIAGEVQIVSAVLRVALGRGLTADQVSAKAYWGRGKANENNGEPGDRPSA